MNTFGQQRADTLLAWYDSHGRKLPWRMTRPNPYRTWLSEIMLQQTTVSTVKPYFRAFTDRWPTVQALAAADLDQVLHGWQGLGYYARARNLHACAGVVVREHGGVFPNHEKELLKLPGIGPYTAAAISAIAFGQKSAPVDGNIERVFARLMMLDKTSPALRPDVVAALMPMVPERRPGDFVQALMDLGAGVCTPRSPRCGECPWSEPEIGGCRAFDAGNPEIYPVKKPKKKKPTRRAFVFWAETKDRRVLLRRRPERGLLGGMMEFPSTDWREEGPDWDKALACAPFAADWQLLPGMVRHTFTHFHLELTVCIGRVEAQQNPIDEEGVWSFEDDFPKYALPTVMKKIVSHVGADREKDENR